ncbi:MAG: beta-galactosidase trimerization domain-containing protein, partial [Armatimonadota bacterium]
MRPWVAALMTVLVVTCAYAADLPVADEEPQVVLPDYAAELRAFDSPDRHPISWHSFMVNAGYGSGRGGPGRKPGAFMDTNWILCDYLDRSGDYVSHEWLKHRGIPYEVYGQNEYQETIHFHESSALPLFRDNGIARDYHDELVLAPQFNLTVESWAERQDFNAYIVCNNAPRWSSVINYDWLSSPLLGYAISQDNIGGPTSRIGAGTSGRYCDWCNLKFNHYLRTHDLLSDYRAKDDHIQDYVSERLDDFPMLATDLRWNEITAEGVAAITDDPVLAEYQKFQYISHAHNLMRYYLDNRLLAERLGIEYDCHGNQGGGFLGINPYQLMISEFVDQVWYESSGLSHYDMFLHGWHNAHGAMRFVLGLASADGKPVLCMTKLRKREPDLVRHEYAESCAGGGVLFSQQVNFLERPDCQEVVREYWQFRHDHRAIFAREGRSRHAQVAMFYSIPTQMYAEYRGNVRAPHFNDVSGLGRAMFEAHIPFDALLLQHPEIRADHWTAEDLSRYRLLIVPSVRCISDEQIAKLSSFLQSGGTIAVMGEFGTRDENNAVRETSALEHLRGQGRVVTLLDGGHMHFNRADESEETRAIVAKAIADIRAALDGETLLDGEIPRMLWVSTWRHQAQGADLLSAHFVNYDVDYESASATPTEPIEVAIQLPEDIAEPQTATWLTTRGEPRELLFQYDDGVALVQVPSVEIYGVLVLGPSGQERAISDRLQGDAMVQRAEWALDGEFGDLGAGIQAIMDLRGDDDAAYADRAEQLLRDTQAALDERYFDEWREMGDTEGAVLALDFGAEEDSQEWTALGPETAYSEERGFGWLPVTDTSEPSPEEVGYAGAYKYASGRQEMGVGHFPFWPYEWRPDNAIFRREIHCGQPRTLRVDLPDGFDYEGRSNDTRETATALSLVEDPADSGYFTAWGLGSIDPAIYERYNEWNESDWWSFEALAGDRVAVGVDTPGSGLDPY